MDGSTTLRVLFGLGLGAAACLVVVNGQTPPKPSAFEVAAIKENVSGGDNASVRAQPGGALILARPDGKPGSQLQPSEEMPRPDGTARPVAPSTEAGHLFTARQEQLGQKLDAHRGPVDVIVIDSTQRPIED